MFSTKLTKSTLQVNSNSRGNGVHQFQCLWLIHDYNMCFINTTTTLGICEYKFQLLCNTQRLKMFRHEIDTSALNVKHISVYLECNKDELPTEEISLQYQVSVMKSDGSLFNTRLCTTSCNNEDTNSFRWGFEDFIPRDFADESKEEFLPGGCLKLLFKGTVWPHLVKEMDTRDLTMNANDCIGGLLLSGKYSDVILSVGDKQFNVHKSILSVRSSVLSAMFSEESNGISQNIIEIRDVEPEVFQEVLFFIYNDTYTSMLDNLADKVIVVAHKYRLVWLKNICEEKLSSGLSIENCIRYFTLANDCDADMLSTLASIFLKTHWKEIMESNTWKTFKDEQPLLVRFITNVFNTK